MKTSGINTKGLSNFLLAAVLAIGTWVAPAQGNRVVGDNGREMIVHPINPRPGYAPSKGGTSPTSPISYYGGPLLTGATTTTAGGGPTVYIIWYGNWNQANGTDTTNGQEIVTDFLYGIGQGTNSTYGSPYFNINTTYSTNTAAGALYAVNGQVAYGGACSVGYLYGNKLSDSTVQSVVSHVICGTAPALLPNDPNGLYFVLSSSDVSENSGFCHRYCGWHTHASVCANDIKYAFIGNAARCITACAAQTVGPNGNPGVDGMVSVIAHELEEATTDADLNAWYDSAGSENADKCAWTFGQNQSQCAANGAYYNVTLPSPHTGPYCVGTGYRNYLIQRNLAHNVAGGSGIGDYCAMSYDPTTGAITQ